MPPEMARQAERLAKKENRTMSELMREAFRQYRTPQMSFKELREYIREIAPPPPELVAVRLEAKKRGLDKMTMKEINSLVAEVRREQANRAKRVRKSA
jgi:hypothetical protein